MNEEKCGVGSGRTLRRPGRAAFAGVLRWRLREVRYEEVEIIGRAWRSVATEDCLGMDTYLNRFGAIEPGIRGIVDDEQLLSAAR